jgi:hypothetical protein
LTSTFVDGLDNHLAWSARSDLDGGTKPVNANLFSWATAFGAFNETLDLESLALCTFWLFDLWTFSGFFVTTLTW